MADELTLQKLMSRMPAAFRPEKAEGVEAVVQYHLTGEQGGDWVITIRDGACQVEEGTTGNPRLTLDADAADYMDLVTGKLNAMNAFAEGKLRLKGDLGLAMKLMGYFKLPA